MKLKILIFSCFFLYFNISYWNSWNIFLSTPTIKELSSNLEKLKEESNDFKIKNKELKQDYGDLISFLKDDLTSIEIEDINNKLEDFIEKKKELDLKLKENISNFIDNTPLKKEILVLRANFYKYLAKYIKKEKKDEYISHIRFQIKSEKESKDLIEEILKNQNLLDQKVSYIKDKIEDHKEKLQSQIEEKISQKIKNRVFEIDSNQKYDIIEQKAKNKIYKNFVSSIEKSINDINNSNLSDNYKDIRKNIFYKMIEEIKTKIK